MEKLSYDKLMETIEYLEAKINDDPIHTIIHRLFAIDILNCLIELQQLRQYQLKPECECKRGVDR